MLRKQLQTERLTPYFFVLPAIIVLFVLLVYPIAKVVEYSLFEGVFLSKNPSFVGLGNYVELLTKDDAFYPTLLHTVVFTVVSVIAHIVLGFLFAILLYNPMNSVANNIFKALLILPWIFIASIVALNWRMILAPTGIVNYMLSWLNIRPHDWYGNPSLAMFSLLVTNAWRGYPFFMVSIFAGLQSIPTTLYEAADMDGARALQKHFYITLPLLRPVILSIAMLDTIWTFRVFPIVWLTTGGGPLGVTEVLSTSIYRQAFFKLNYSMASAQSVVILVAVSIFAIFYVRRQRASM